MNRELLKVEDLKTYFAIRKGLLRRRVGYARAVDGVSFGIRRGRVLGLVGESGCGKTTVAQSIARLVPATAGRVVFDGEDVLSVNKRRLRQLRKQISVVFQDPFGSLNPRMNVGNIIGEPLRVHEKLSGCEVTEKVAALLCKVGLSGECMNRYPHEFSSGQRQRIGIARALVLEPKLVICDEPVSALDVSVQAQILNLLKDLQEEFELTFLFIAHNLAVVEFFCDVVAVMYMGRIVEQGESEELYSNPRHPYTYALMSAVPGGVCSRADKRGGVESEMTSVFDRAVGCAFAPRCPLAEGDCLKRAPVLEEKGNCQGHFVACWKC